MSNFQKKLEINQQAFVKAKQCNSTLQREVQTRQNVKNIKSAQYRVNAVANSNKKISY